MDDGGNGVNASDVSPVLQCHLNAKATGRDDDGFRGRGEYVISSGMVYRYCSSMLEGGLSGGAGVQGQYELYVIVYAAAGWSALEMELLRVAQFLNAK